MNEIPRLQNTKPYLRLLRARSQVYAEAVQYQVAQIAVAVVIPVIGALIGLFEVRARPYVAIIALIVTALDACWLDRAQRRKLKTAASISEKLDCGLLQIPWNNFSAGKPVDPELIDASARTWAGGDDRLRDWYPAAVGTVPLHLARIVCQRTNLWYDSELRRRYARILVASSVILPLVLFCTALATGLKVVDLATLLTPAAPVLVWALRENFRQLDAAQAIESLKGEAEKLFDAAKTGGCDEAECGCRSREFQDGIFTRRSANPLIFPFIYSWMRDEMETRMNAGADELVGDLRS